MIINVLFPKCMSLYFKVFFILAFGNLINNNLDGGIKWGICNKKEGLKLYNTIADIDGQSQNASL